MSKIINEIDIERFRNELYENEKSSATLAKYLHDVRCFLAFSAGREVEKGLVLEYKKYLADHYAKSSANSMIAALNSFFRFMQWNDCTVRQFLIQKKIYCEKAKELTKKEYEILVKTARRKGNARMCMVIQTLYETGIRISELSSFTVEAINRGEVTITCKRKTRTVFIVDSFREILLEYIKVHGIVSGPVFITSSGKPMDRSNIWREMKKLCKDARVLETKVFPHNLRHLFARDFYKVEKDIAALADVLGHSNISTTRIYITSTGEDHRRQMERMRKTS